MSISRHSDIRESGELTDKKPSTATNVPITSLYISSDISGPSSIPTMTRIPPMPIIPFVSDSPPHSVDNDADTVPPTTGSTVCARCFAALIAALSLAEDSSVCNDIVPRSTAPTSVTRKSACRFTPCIRADTELKPNEESSESASIAARRDVKIGVITPEKSDTVTAMPTDCPAEVYPPPPDSDTAEKSGIMDEKKPLIFDMESVMSKKTSIIPI